MMVVVELAAVEGVELEGADVALLVGSRLALEGVVVVAVEALLELAVLLEAVFLCHLLLLLIGLHDASLASELRHLTIEEGVFAELAL